MNRSFNLNEIYERRPFKIRNADEYDLWQVLSLFVSPFEGLATPFDFTNTIIKGRMGSGKTMYLRANHAFHLYGLIPALLDNESDFILPIFIKLSDFQHIKKADVIYKSVIIKIVEEIATVYLTLEDTKRMARIQHGMKSLTPDVLAGVKIADSLTHLTKLGSDEFVERLSTELGLKGGIKPKFMELSGEFKRSRLTEVKQKPNPGIKDIEEAYESLLKDQHGEILLLIDEAGALDKSFFKGKENDSPFEILMNQLRTLSFLRTKIAIYPNSFQDVLTETRYGDAVLLEENIAEEQGYLDFRKKALELITKYLNPERAYEGDITIAPSDIFEINMSEQYGDALEQLINASNGNVRRFVQLLDTSLEVAYRDHKGTSETTIDHVYEALRQNAKEMIDQYSEPDRDFIANLAKACRNRSTYKFEFPYRSGSLNKFTSKSEEYNVLRVIQLGTGRKSTVYAFDYNYCVANQIPTHYSHGSERIDRSRSLASGRWIPRIAHLSEEILDHASITKKIDGEIEFVRDSSGFIQGDDGNRYFFTDEYIIDEDRNKKIIEGRRARFIPHSIGNTRVAQGIEIL